MPDIDFYFYDWEKYKTLEGVYVAQYRQVGKWKKNVFGFKLDIGPVVHAWADAALYRAFYGIPFQTRVKITYLGMETMPDGSNKVFKNYEVEVLELAKPKEKKKMKKNKIKEKK
jgi:hypothetical protein